MSGAGPTSIPFGDAKAVKRWSGSLFLDVLRKGYFEQRFTGTGENHVIQRLTELESEPGDTITFDLSVQLRNKPVTGDNRLKGSEEGLRFSTDTVKIDQMRSGVDVGGRMTRKRTVHDLRKIAKARLSEYWAQYIDQMIFTYLSGARGINQDFIESVAWAGFAENAIQAPDAAHTMYGGDATGKASIASDDLMTRVLIERAEVKARMMRALDPTAANMMPVMINGEAHYVCVMSTFQEHQLRTASGSDWLDIQKAAAAAEGRNNPIFKGKLGMIKNVVLHAHENVIRFSDYGSGVNLPAARALFMGRQAAVIAYGSTKGLRFAWTEETDDHGNAQTIAAGVIMGLKKSRFGAKDFGVIAIDTYAIDPNA